MLASAGAALLAASFAGSALARPLHVQLDNGIEATIYPPEYILEHLTEKHGDETLLVLDESTSYHLISHISDAAIANKGDGQFHPMSLDAVVEELRAIRLRDTGLEVRVYVLPYPRREVLDSSAHDGAILLSPGVRPVSDNIVHFTVTHEVGHLYQYRWMPDEDSRNWARFDAMRSISDHGIYNSASAHQNRPHEIFAEDFRFLFGGSMSTYSGGIENESLALPSQVVGLEEFLRGLCESRGAALPPAELLPSPNPFNPSTEIQLQFRAEPGPEPVTVRVLDARGHEVRRLFEGHATSRSMRLPWDGKQASGEPASSGVYFASMDYQGAIISTKLLLLK